MMHADDASVIEPPPQRARAAVTRAFRRPRSVRTDPARVEWVDTAKGIAIILVVLFHAVIFLADIGLAGGWVRISVPLDTFRMPLFFFTAGLFASKALRMPFGQMIRRRVVRLVYLYALWTTLWIFASQLIPAHRPRTELHVLLQLLAMWVWPNPSTWFVYALGLYFIAAWLLLRAPNWLGLSTALTSAVLFGAGIFQTGSEPLDKMGAYFLWFFLAVRFGQRVIVWAGTATFVRTVLLGLGYGALTAAILVLQIGGIPGVRLLASAFAVAFGVALSAVLARRFTFHWLRQLGRRTLAIYFLHYYIVLGAVAVLAEFAPAGVPEPLWVPMLTVAGVALPVLVQKLTQPLLPWLWDSPFAGTGIQRTRG